MSVELLAKIDPKFIFKGLEELGEVLGASHDDQGLTLATKSGAVARCAGMPRQGIWHCQQAGERS